MEVSAKRGQAVSEADIVVAAVGRPELITGDWIKPGAVVIDTGYNPGNIGDVEYTAAAQQARLITPVPAGVGPTTVALLLAQTVDAAELGGQFDVLGGLPRPGADGTVDEFGLAIAVHRLSESIVEAVPDGADGGHRTDFGETFAVADGRELRSGIGVTSQPRQRLSSRPAGHLDGIEDHGGGVFEVRRRGDDPVTGDR
jgi:hypothetical protein